MRPRLLDLFSGAGGCSVGYQRAGFDVVGVDIEPQPRFPFAFVQADALEYVREHGREFDVIHASPPCQRYSAVTPRGRRDAHPDLIDATREALQGASVPWVIENVSGAPLRASVMLCGSMFSLRCQRHRYFEINPPTLILTRPCDHSLPPLLVTTAGANSRRAGNFKSTRNAPAAYGIDWMNGAELAQAIPPAYCEFIGLRLIRQLAEVA